MTRGEFIKTAGAATAMAIAGRTLGASEKAVCGKRPATDYAALQKEVDEVTPAVFSKYCASGETELAALRRLDAAFEKVLGEVRSTTVTGNPAIWLVYNMGLVVKTPKACFSVDLRHPRAKEMEPLLDFAVISHNHGDHFDEDFYRAMDKAGKTVISNFKDNYGIKDRKQGGYTRAKKTFQIKDVEVRTSLTDHNAYLIDFTTVTEIRVGKFVLYHTGDCSNVGKLGPTKKPDLWVVHPRCGMKVADGVRKFGPKKTVIAHINELGHDKWRWTWQDGLAEKAAAEATGGKSILPVWGERIA